MHVYYDKMLISHCLCFVHYIVNMDFEQLYILYFLSLITTSMHFIIYTHLCWKYGKKYNRKPSEDTYAIKSCFYKIFIIQAICLF